MSTEIMVTVADVRAIKFCSRGARMWFTRHGLDYNEFVTRGLPVDQIESTDALGKQAATQARLRAVGEEE